MIESLNRRPASLSRGEFEELIMVSKDRRDVCAVKFDRFVGSCGLCGTGNGSGPVIRNSQGEPLCGPRYWFEKAIRTAGIEGFHDTIPVTRSLYG